MPSLKVLSTNEIVDGNRLLTLHSECQKCKRRVEIVNVPAGNFMEWQLGFKVQDALPMLDANDREFLISGTCGTCFDKMFSDA